MADCMTLLLTSNIITGITCVWTNVLPNGWFYAIMLATLEIVIFLKYDNILAPSLLGLFVGVLMIAYLPIAAWAVPLGIIIVNTAAMLYTVLERD